MADEPTHIYISGPMRGRDGFNFPAFFAAEGVLRGYFPDADICNPAREDIVRFNLHTLLELDPTGMTAGRYLQRTPEDFTPADLRAALGNDLKYITEHCDLVVLLPGWNESKGAVAESATAHALGIDVMVFDGLSERLREVLEGDHTTPGPQDAPVADSVTLAGSSGEVRVTSETGGEKGSKLATFDQVSPEVEWLVAEHFGKGARKYSAHNFRKGYPWSLSYSALRRHLAAFWAGEEYDNHNLDCPEDCTEHTGSLHIVAVIWHAMVLTEFYLHHKEYDDRYVY